MGSIRNINHHSNWEILLSGKFTKDTSKIAYSVKIGYIDDYHSYGFMTAWMLKDVYDGIMRGDLKYITNPYSETPLIILDKRGLPINPLDTKLKL